MGWVFGKKRCQWEKDFSQFERKARIEVARAIAEDGLTGERKQKALAKIEEAERKLKHV